MLASPAMRAETLVDATSPQRILEIAKGYGSASLEVKDGDPFISGRIEGSKYGIYFYGCKSGKKCTNIQFSAGWSGVKTSLSDINAWNRDKRFSKAYLDSVNDPNLEMDVNLDSGVSKANLEDTFDFWVTGLRTFKKTILDQ